MKILHTDIYQQYTCRIRRNYTSPGLPNRHRDDHGLPNNLHLPHLRHPQHPDRPLRMSRPGPHRVGDLPLRTPGQMLALPASLSDALHRPSDNRLRWTDAAASLLLVLLVLSHLLIIDMFYW